ncbi:MAG: ATP-binding protein, partial [Acidobacteria bacterium]|nr:ATP-binding protein [Acidobacteriota bacterium]
LLSNAAKFSPEGGAVDVYVDRVGQGLRVTVVDHGPGVPESFRDQLFRKFSRADHAVTRQIPGTGLGLAISRAIIEEHRGTLNLDRHYREGAAFFFILPEAEQALGVGPTMEPSVFSY